MQEQKAQKEAQKKQAVLDEVRQEKKVLKELKDMRDDYIREEIKNGNIQVIDEVQ